MNCAPPSRLDSRAVRSVTRNDAPLGAGRQRWLWLLPLSQPLFWGYRLYLSAPGEGVPIGWELAAANIGERTVATEMAHRVPLAGHTVIADKGFAGAESEDLMARCGATFLRPDRRNEARRHGSLSQVRQWLESTFWTCDSVSKPRRPHHRVGAPPGRSRACSSRR